MAMKSMKECREIAARVWCDQDMRSEVMNVEAAQKIADILFESLNRSGINAAVRLLNGVEDGKSHDPN